MSGRIDARLKELGIGLPKAAAPAANYVPFVVTGNLVFVSGQLPFENGELKHKGIVGSGVSAEDAVKAATEAASVGLMMPL